MLLNRNRILRFVGFTVLWFILVCVVWYFLIGPVYNDALAGLADKLTPGKDIWHMNDNIYVLPEGVELSNGIYALDLQYGLLLLIALIAATPGLQLIQRLKYIPVAFVVMFVIHVIGILIFAWSAPGDNPLLVLFSVLGSALFPIVIWGILSFRYFMPKLQEASSIKASLRPKGKKRWEITR